VATLSSSRTLYLEFFFDQTMEKGRVERAIRYVSESFWAGRFFTTLAECNRRALVWRDQMAHRRRWPGDDSRTVGEAFAEEQPRLLPKAVSQKKPRPRRIPQFRSRN
jgi:hypothetical protein